MDNANIQKLLKIKALLAGQKTQNFDGGGAVSPEVPAELAPYMPTEAEAAASGYPPGPQRSIYIAMKKKQAAQATQGYDEGGEVQPKPEASQGPALDPEKVKQFQKGFNSGDVSVASALANAKKALGFAKGGMVGYDEGGTVAPSLSDLSDDQLKTLLNKSSDSVSDNSDADKNITAPGASQVEQLLSQASGGQLGKPASDDQTQQAKNSLSDLLNDPNSKENTQDGESLKGPLPNGGATGDVLASLIKQNPGSAATAGNNPNLSPEDRAVASADDADDSDNDSSPAASKAKAAPASSPVADLLAKLQQPPSQSSQYDPYNMDALKAAQDQQRNLTGLSGIARGLGTIGAAISRGNYKNDSGFFDDFNKNQAAAPINKLLQQQQVATAGTEHQLKQYALADEKEKNDPNSTASKLAQTMISNLGKQIGMNVGDVSKLSGSAIEKSPIWKAMEMTNNVKMRELAQQNQLDMKKLMLGNQVEHRDEGQIANAQKQLTTNKSYQTASDALTAAQDVRKMLDEARSNGSAAQVVPVLVARLMTHGQRINQPEIHAATGSPDIASWAKRITNKAASGTLDNTDYQQMTRLANVIESGAVQTKSQMENEAASRFSQSTKGRYDQSSAYKALTGRDYVAPGQQTGPGGRTPQSSSGTYSPSQEAGIAAVMNGNNVSRDIAVAALKKAGKL